VIDSWNTIAGAVVMGTGSEVTTREKQYYKNISEGKE
jgi:hypothetical protein